MLPEGKLEMEEVGIGLKKFLEKALPGLTGYVAFSYMSREGAKDLILISDKGVIKAAFLENLGKKQRTFGERVFKKTKDIKKGVAQRVSLSREKVELFLALHEEAKTKPRKLKDLEVLGIFEEEKKEIKKEKKTEEKKPLERRDILRMLGFKD